MTMTATRPVETIDVATSEAMDWDIACERGVRPGPHLAACRGEGKAEWVLYFTCGCPPAHVLYCTACKDACVERDWCFCEICGTTFTPASTAYCLIEPLNRRQP